MQTNAKMSQFFSHNFLIIIWLRLSRH